LRRVLCSATAHRVDCTFPFPHGSARACRSSLLIHRRVLRAPAPSEYHTHFPADGWQSYAGMPLRRLYSKRAMTFVRCRHCLVTRTSGRRCSLPMCSTGVDAASRVQPSSSASLRKLRCCTAVAYRGTVQSVTGPEVSQPVLTSMTHVAQCAFVLARSLMT